MNSKVYEIVENNFQEFKCAENGVLNNSEKKAICRNTEDFLLNDVQLSDNKVHLVNEEDNKNKLNIKDDRIKNNNVGITLNKLLNSNENDENLNRYSSLSHSSSSGISDGMTQLLDSYNENLTKENSDIGKSKIASQCTYKTSEKLFHLEDNTNNWKPNDRMVQSEYNMNYDTIIEGNYLFLFFQNGIFNIKNQIIYFYKIEILFTFVKLYAMNYK